MSEYTIVHKPKEKLPYWIIPPDCNENIASGCKHKTREEADKHCALLNAFFPTNGSIK
jgi:hypothetical protein